MDMAIWPDDRIPLPLAALRLPATLDLLVLAPHPDDFDAIAASLRFLRDRGNRLEVAVATSGASGVESGFGGTTTAGERSALRELEQQASCRLFGLPEDRLRFLRLHEDLDGHPLHCRDNLRLVASCLRDHRPGLVFLPHWHDPNEGHQRTYALFRQSVEEEKLSLAACLNQDPKTLAMRRDLYFAFGPETAAWKGELLRLHQSQQQRNLRQRGYGLDERILRVNRRAAETLALHEPYAEVFELEIYSRGNAVAGTLEKLNTQYEEL